MIKPLRTAISFELLGLFPDRIAQYTHTYSTTTDTSKLPPELCANDLIIK